MLFSVRSTQENPQFLDKMYPTILSPPPPSSPAPPHLLLLPLLLFFPASLSTCFVPVTLLTSFPLTPTDKMTSLSQTFYTDSVSYSFYSQQDFFNVKCLVFCALLLSPRQGSKGQLSKAQHCSCLCSGYLRSLLDLGNVRQLMNSLYSGTRRGGSQNHRRVPLVRCCPSG